MLEIRFLAGTSDGSHGVAHAPVLAQINGIRRPHRPGHCRPIRARSHLPHGDGDLRLTQLFPDDPEILYRSGRLFSDQAYRLTMRLADVAPASVWMHQAAGEANESMGNYDGALGEYRKVLELAPERPGTHYRLGRVYLARARAPLAEAGAGKNAEREFAQELEVDPNNAEAAYELAELRRKSGDVDGARDLFAQSVARSPDFERGQLGLGRVMMAQGHPDLALPHLEKAATLDPEDDMAFYQLWQVYRALGREEQENKALAEFRRLRAKRREEERMGLLRQQVGTEQELEDQAKPHQQDQTKQH